MILETDPGKGASSAISWRQVCLSQENASFSKTKEPEAEYSAAHLLTEGAMGPTWSFRGKHSLHSPYPLVLFNNNNLVKRKQAWGKSQSSTFCSKWTVSTFSSGYLDSLVLLYLPSLPALLNQFTDYWRETESQGRSCPCETHRPGCGKGDIKRRPGRSYCSCVKSWFERMRS